MAKFYFKQLFAALLLLCSIVAGAQTLITVQGVGERLVVDNLYYAITSDTTVELSACCKRNILGKWSLDPKGYAGEIVIPATVTDANGVTYAVTSIAGGNNQETKSAFSYCTALTGVTIGSNVTSIGANAFYDCTALTTVTIPNNVTSIGGAAFSGCTALASVTIGDGVTSIGNGVFDGCANLADITIGNSVTSIGDYAFYDCESLTSITIPNSVTSIGDYAFYNCTGLTGVTIGNSVTSIGNYAFYDCSGLKEVHISDLAAWCKIAFFNFVSNPLYYAHNLYLNGEKVTNLVIPDGVTEIKDCAFFGCNGLTGVTIGNSVTTIGDYAFYDCSGLTGELIIPNSVTSIGDDAFAYCSGLTSINLGNGVKLISLYAFRYCTALESIVVAADNMVYDSRSNCNAVIETETNRLVLGCKNTKIPADVTSIGVNAFCGCSGLTSIVIPDGVESIGNNAFYDCSNLADITFPASLRNIASNAFDGTAWYDNQPDGLLYADKVLYGYKGTMPEDTSIAIKEGTLAIAEAAFSNAAALSSVTIPGSVKVIGQYAFNKCYNLANLVIEDGVESINTCAFQDCDALTSVEIPGSVKIVGHAVFNDCYRLESATFGYGIESIGNLAFQNCDALTSVEIPGSVKSIGVKAFYECNNLANVVIGNGVESIGDEAFYAAFYTLLDITIPGSVKELGDDIVYNHYKLNVHLDENSLAAWCQADFSPALHYMDRESERNLYIAGIVVTDLNIPAGVKRIGSYSITNCVALSSVTLPAGIDSICNGAFYRNTNLQSINIPAGVTYVGNIAFQYSDLRSIHIPASLVEIVDYAFSWNLNLSSITIDDENPVYSIPEGGRNILMETATKKVVLACKGAVIPETATAIGNGAFNGVGGIESITIPAGITSIGDWAFDGCRDLVAIYSPSTTPAKVSSSSFTDTSTATLYVPIGAKEAYATAWGFDNIVETDFTGVDGVTADEQTGGNELYYDLSGRAVKNPANGIYIYKGKKVLVE